MTQFPSSSRRLTIAAILLLSFGLTEEQDVRAQQGASSEVTRRRGVNVPAPTTHPALPTSVGQYWLVPEAVTPRSSSPVTARAGALDRFAQGVGLIRDGNYSAGLTLVSAPELQSTPLAAYARYYAGVALLALSRPTEAEAAFTAANARKPTGYLQEALPLRLAATALARQDAKRAKHILKDLSDEPLAMPETVWFELGRAAELAGDREDAVDAYRRLYYDYPLSAQANDAQPALDRLRTANAITAERVKPELARAETLFAARRWAQARAGFDPITRVGRDDDAELAALRVAECDYYLGRYASARDALARFLEKGPYRAEARFFSLSATRALGQTDAYLAQARALVSDAPDSPWTEETLNNLATHYVLIDQDDAADAVFREVYRRFPRGRYAERAAWRVGWRLYRGRQFQEAADLFDEAAVALPRADMRPSWLYWSGRALDQLGQQTTATGRYRVAVADYQNSYYGRLASAILATRGGGSGQAPAASATLSAAGGSAARIIPTDALIRQLIALELYDDALREVQYAQRAWGDSSVLQATTAFVRHEQGRHLRATERFNALRGAITTMRAAYPQFMAAGGESLPPDVLRVIFPLDYWPLITKYSAQHDLDPYLMAALMAQESTFTAEIVSHANAYGLLQLVPAAGRQYARKLGIKRFSTSMLTDPETNVRMGMQYFKDLSDKFGGTYFALASYNAGPGRVAAWRQEKPNLPQDEFIDDIPYRETQTYVKRILGTAEDYRTLYGGGLLDPTRFVAAITTGSSSTIVPNTAKRAPVTKTAAKRPLPKKAAAKAKPSTAKKAPVTRPRAARRR